MVLYGADNLTDRRQAYDLLALAAKEYWGLNTLPPMARTAQGKPWFPEAPERAFNLSHSGTLALCALSSQPVGVDIQVVKPHRPGLPTRVCSAEELAWLQEQPDLWTAFALLWTLKEARVKYSGTGLTLPIHGISVPLPLPGKTLFFQDGLWFRLYQGAGWQAAACGQSPPPEAIRWCSL